MSGVSIRLVLFFLGAPCCFSTLLCAHLELGLIVSSHFMILSWFVCRSVVGFSLFFWWVGFFRLQTDPCVGSETIDGTIAPRIVTLDTGSWCFGLGFWRWVLLRFGCEIFFLHDCVAESLICRKRRYSTKRVSAGRIASDSEEFANQVLGFWIVLWMALVWEN